MPSSTFFSSLCFSFFFIPMVIAQPDFIYYTCVFDQGNYTTNSTYKANLDHLLSTFTTDHQIEYGFYNFSYGQENKANAIGLCRGDIMPDDCRSCLNDSISRLTSLCPNQTEAIGWYDKCMLRYSDRSLFGFMEPSPAFYSWNQNNASDQNRFTLVATNLLQALAGKAASGSSRLKFATGNTAVPNFPIIYGAVQCTPDLSEQDCSRCLLEAISQIRQCCDGRLGGRIGRPSCNFRFETYSFFQEPPATTPPPSLLSNTTAPAEGHASRIVIIIVVPIIVVVAAVVLIFSICIIFLRTRKTRSNAAKSPPEDEVTNVETSLFDFDTIRIATDGFSDANKLGEGGFGAVYKGRLPSGQDIAVKRLFRSSSQGDVEFKNEISVVAKLQHRNLVQLLGFCFKKEEKLLIYEFVENSSLEKFLFAKLFIHDQTQGDTRRIVGTYGYMAPEYVQNGHFSVKSDVFSFGVLILEIVSGQKNNRAQTNNEIAEGLVSYAWRNWKNGTAQNIVDSCLRSGSRTEMARCIHVGLLCVQENFDERPTMTTVLLMLNGCSITLPRPSPSAFFIKSSGSQMSWQSEHNSTQEPNDMSISELDPR